jgi:hypothetical protein
MTSANGQNQSLTGDSLATYLAGNAIPNIQPDPIPPHIAGNLLEFLRRVQSTGMEAVAWVEAYQFVQKHAPQQQLPAPPKG